MKSGDSSKSASARFRKAASDAKTGLKGSDWKGSSRKVASGADRAAKRMGEEAETYDVVVDFLCDYGIAESLEEAQWMMVNEVDSEDIETILEAYGLDEATVMAKRGYDEAPIRQKIAKSTGGGQAADRATKLASKPTFGNDKAAKQRSDYARNQRGDFRKTTSSSPGLHGYGYQSNNPAVKAKQSYKRRTKRCSIPNEKKSLGR